MTVMLLALMMGDAALSGSDSVEYGGLRDGGAISEPYVVAPVRGRAWTPRVDDWSDEKAGCPAFFQREVKGFGVFRVGPACADEEIPYAL